MKKHNGHTLADLLESFFRRRLVAERRASTNTVDTYREALKLFLVFASEQCSKPPSRLSIEELDREMVLAFLDHLENIRRNSVRTRNARLIAIRSFFQHVAYSDPALMGIVQRVMAIPNKRVDKTMINYLTQVELDAILDAPNRETPRGRRDYALLLFLARTGARESEAIGVNANDLRLERPLQVLIRGKGSKERTTPLAEDIAKVLLELFHERELAPEGKGPVFVNRNGERLGRYGVIHIVRHAVARASQTNPMLAKQHISPHTFRHTLAMQLLQSGVDLSIIRSWLGHVSLDTTHQYTEADIEMKRRALEKCPITEAKYAPYQPSDSILALLERI